MSHPAPSESAPERVSEAVATRLLARASELDAAHDTRSSVVELRAAAAAAGISAHAFEAALAEVRETAKANTLRTARHRRTWIRAAIVALVLAAGMLTVIAQRTPRNVAAASGAPMHEEAVLLRCIAADDAAALIRPLLTLPTNQLVLSSSASRTLTIRATTQQLEQVKAALAPYEAAGAPSCAARR